MAQSEEKGHSVIADSVVGGGLRVVIPRVARQPEAPASKCA